MKYIPMLFSTPMVQAILNGTKTQTRRVVKPNSAEAYALLINLEAGADVERCKAELINAYCPYGQPGDVIWVREQYCETSREYIDKISGLPYVYKASAKGPDADEVMKEFGWKWKPSIHMPKEACRIFLQIKSIRVERLNDISEADAIAEGVTKGECGNYYVLPDIMDGHSAAGAFNKLWCKINGADSWQANPFVWRIEFERIDKPENFI